MRGGGVGGRGFQSAGRCEGAYQALENAWRGVRGGEGTVLAVVFTGIISTKP